MKFSYLTIFPALLLTHYVTLGQTTPHDHERNIKLGGKSDEARIDQLISKSGDNYYVNNDSVIIYAKEAEKLSLLISYRRGIMKAKERLSVAYFIQGQHLNSYRELMEALNWVTPELKKEEADINYRLAGTILRLGDRKASIEYVDKALSYGIAMKDSIVVSSCNNHLGLVYYSNEEYRKAIPYFIKCLVMSKDTKMNSIPLTNIARCYSYLKDYDSANEYAIKALEQNRDRRDMRLINIYNILGEIALSRSDLTNAKLYLETSMSLMKELKIATATNYIALAKVYSGLGQKNLTEKYLLEGYAKLQGRILDRVSITRDLYQFYDTQNQLNKAYRFLQQYSIYADSLDKMNRDDAIKDMETKKQFEAEVKEQQHRHAMEKLQSDLQLNEERKDRNLLIVGICLLVCLVLYIYVSFRKKKVLNLELAEKNRFIGKQNLELQHYISELHTTHRKLIESEKMAVLGLLSSGLAQEIDNPLNNISDSVQALENIQVKIGALPGANQSEVKNISNELQQLTKLIKVGVDKSLGIISSLKFFTSVNENEQMGEQVVVEELMHEVLRLINHKVKFWKIKVVEEYGSMRLVPGNKGLLARVFLNLLQNSIEAIAACGRPGTIHIKTEELDKYMRIEISDDGIGIDDDVKSKMFNPFFTTKAIGQGTGLGLTSAYEIIKDHKGNLYLGQGDLTTTFFIELPTAESDFMGSLHIRK